MTIKTLADLPAATHAERLEVVQFDHFARRIQSGAIRDTKSLECDIGFGDAGKAFRKTASYANLRAKLEARQ